MPLFRFKHIIHGFCVFICPKHANTGIGITGIAVSKCIKLKKKRLSHRQRKNTLTSLHFHTQIYTRQKNACPVMSIYARGLCCDICHWSVIFFLIDSVGGLRVAWSGVALCKCMEIVPRNATIRNHLFPPPPLHHPGVCNRCSQRQAGGFDVERCAKYFRVRFQFGLHRHRHHRIVVVVGQRNVRCGLNCSKRPT